MALQEFDADEIAHLRAQAAASHPSKVLLDKLGANPKTRNQVLRLIKEIEPNIAIPEIDAAAPVLDEVKQTREELAALRKQITDEKAANEKLAREQALDTEMETGRKYLRGRGYQVEGITSVEKKMLEEGITSYKAGAALYEQDQPKDEPSMPSDYGRHMLMPFEDDTASEELKKIAQMGRKQAGRAISKWADREWRVALAEHRGQPVARRA